MIDKSELLGYFLSEAIEHINVLERGILQLQDSPDKGSLVEDLFRIAHTLKGSAALVKLTLTSNLAHQMEDLLESLMNREIELSDKLIESLFHILEGIKILISRVSRGEEEFLENERVLIEEADEILKGRREVVSSTKDLVMVEEFLSDKWEDKETLQASSLIGSRDEDASRFGRRKEDFLFYITKYVKIDSEKIEDMLNLMGEIIIKKNYLIKRAKDFDEIRDEIFFTCRRLFFEVSDFTERYAYSMPENIRYVDPLLSEFGELEFDKYDDLNLFSRKLQEITNDIIESLKAFDKFFESLSDDLKDMDKLIKMLKLSVTDSRMMEIGILFRHFIKPVSELAERHNKKVEFITMGGSLKVDRVIFERLFNPLMHLIINAIVHGIEPPDERLKKDKKVVGTILLSAKKDRGFAVIDISDDGKGIDVDNLYREAVRLGLLKSEEKPSKEQLLSLIFLPGFSTAETANITAGRGIGLSAVKEMVYALNGFIELFTERDVGTTFRIKVPLTLAIANVLLFRCGGIEFVVPSDFIEEVMLLSQPYNQRVFEHRGGKVELIELTETLGINYRSDISQKYVLICNVYEKKIGLIVDDVMGQEETIIKPMHSFLEGLQVYSGTTISGDGTIRFVINPANLIEQQFRPLSPLDLGIRTLVKKNVLVVDDSISVRKYVSTFLQTKNFNVYTATNGAEALDLIQSTPIDMVITDLEMPVIHGYELIARLKASEKYRGIPIIVLTSRGGKKHQEKALELGAKDYLIKPFDEESLMRILNKHFELSYA
ncbi:MAG: response regulator [Thermodesulfovibrionales bacterium]|nr:response regulator [Thermodesulfovibrionales bacterium]